jgi:hypothetical protein
MASKNNPAGPMPALVALVAAVCGIAGVSLSTSAQVQTAVASGAALVLAVWQWQHHRTIRNYDTQAAAVVTAKAATAQTQNVADAQRALQAAAQANHGAGWPTAHADARPVTPAEWSTAADAVREYRGMASAASRLTSSGPAVGSGA